MGKKFEDYVFFGDKIYIPINAKLAFAWNLVIIYLIGFFFDQFNFVWW